MAVPSPDDIDAARTAAGAWTRPQLAEWGVPWPPPKGWKNRLIEQWKTSCRQQEAGVRTVEATMSGKCSDTTKQGTPCQIDARPSGRCHVHDSEVQCGEPTSKGHPCTIATGGGPCPLHRPADR